MFWNRNPGWRSAATPLRLPWAIVSDAFSVKLAKDRGTKKGQLSRTTRSETRAEREMHFFPAARVMLLPAITLHSPLTTRSYPTGRGDFQPNIWPPAGWGERGVLVCAGVL
jgi:hypothetical protein